MQFHAKSVSTSNSGDYYQALFEDDDLTDGYSSYLLIQREFEGDDVGESYFLKLMTGCIQVTFACFDLISNKMESLLRLTARTIGLFK